MKKIFVTLFAAAALALVLAPVVSAAPADKVAICHVNSANDTVWFFGTFVFGQQTEVAAPALPAHFNHGDDTDFYSLESNFGQFLVGLLQELGLALPNADCVFRS